MTASSVPPPADPGPMVPLLSVKCPACTRAAKARSHRQPTGRLTLPGQRPAGCTCRRVWAPGQGPERADDSPVGEPPPPDGPDRPAV